MALGGTASWSATFVVNSPADSHDIAPGDGFAADHTDPDSARSTLRAALEEANALPGPDTDTYIPDSMRYDQLHFNRVGLMVHAMLWFRALHFSEG